MKLLILLILVASVLCEPPPHRYGGHVISTACDDKQPLQTWNYNAARKAYYIANFCLDSNPTKSSGQYPSGYACGVNITSQMWSQDALGHMISNAKCMQIVYNHGAAYSNVLMASCMTAANALNNLQVFEVRTVSGGVKFVNKGTNQCLQLESLAGVTLDKYRDWPIVIGHRGSTFEAPENTMPAFINALDHGADGVETDLRVTKDNVVVLLHDETVDRTSNCKGRVRDLTYAQLMQCDFGKSFDGKFVGTKIPTFEELVKLASSRNAYIVMDLYVLASNDEMQVRAKEMKRIIDLYNFHAYAIASCRSDDEVHMFNWLTNGTVLQRLQDQPAGYNNREFWKEKMTWHLNGFSLSQTTITPDFVRLAHGRLMSVFMWTPDALAEQWNALLWGVDGVITGDTRMMFEVIKQHRTVLNTLI